MLATDRRRFLAFAGTATALSGCGISSEKGAPTQTLSNHGDDPRRNLEQDPDKRVKAQFYRLVVIRGLSPLNVNHASFKTKDLTGHEYETENKIRNNIIQNLADNQFSQTGSVKHFANGSYWTGSYGENWDISTFGFGHPHHVYFYLHGQGLKFDKHDPIFFKDTSSSLINSKKPTYAISENKSFYDAKVINANGNDRLLYVENYFKDASGPIVGSALSHPFGLNYLMQTFAGEVERNGKLQHEIREVRGVLDPDTGNGSSWNPRK